MSQLSKVLEARIHELTASIDAQKTELAAYERVLHMETKGGGVSEADLASEEEPENDEPEKKPRGRKKRAVKKYKPRAASSPAPEEGSTPVPKVDFQGNKTNMVAAIVGAYGSKGASPKEVDAVFSAQKIERSKNLIYNTLSYLVAQKKLQRKDGRYFPSGATPASAPKAPEASSAPAPTKSKRRLSPEGLKKIKEALKRRWAAKHAADAPPAPRKPGRPPKKAV